ncbi:condensation domain-containing protein [Streptomyces stramineus]
MEPAVQQEKAPRPREEPGRSASFNQDKHFAVAQEAREVNDPLSSWIAITCELPGKLDRPALEAALLLFVRRHEVLRCEFRRLAGDLGCEVLGPDDIALECADVGISGSTAELRSYLADRFEKGIDTLSWPLLVMGAVVREHSSTVYLCFDHIVSDGMSMPNAVNDIETAYAALSRNGEAGLPAAGSYLDFGHEQRRRYLTLGADDDRLAYWKAFIARNGGFFPKFPLELGVEPGRTYPTVNESEKLLDDHEVGVLETRCRDAGGRLFMGLLAALAVSLRRSGGPGDYRCLMPVSERGRGSWTHSMGWFVNTMPLEFSVAEDKDFPEVLAGVRAASRR